MAHRIETHETRSGLRTDRLAGVGGLVFVATLVVQNIIRAAGPGFGAATRLLTALVDRFSVLELSDRYCARCASERSRPSENPGSAGARGAALRRRRAQPLVLDQLRQLATARLQV